MIKDSTLIVRGQVLWETGDNQWNPQGQRQHWSDVLIARAYKGASSSVIRVSWKEYLGCPRARVNKDDLLGSLRRPIDTAELRALLPTNNEVLESAVHLALLKLHDYSELETSGRLVETVPASRSFRLPEQEAAYLRTEIGSEIERIEDPRQLPILQRFTLSSNVWLRENAAYAVRHLHDFSSVRYLIRLIDDPSEETRIQAIRGLTELLRPGIKGYGWLPGTPLNGREVTEQEVIARWRAWWQAEGESKYGK